MNWVFWFLVILAIFAVWCAVSPLFPGIGRSTKHESRCIKDDLAYDDVEVINENEEIKKDGIIHERR